MSDLIFVTGNSMKMKIASGVCKRNGINLRQLQVHFDEVQSEDIEYITVKKGEAAYAALQQPLVVNDDTWSIPGLNGFPGPYMKSMNHWFSVDDWLNLTRNLNDRTVYLHQTIVYTNGQIIKSFTNTIQGMLLAEPRGSDVDSARSVISMAGDEGKSIAEMLALSDDHYSKRDAGAVWQSFCDWYNQARH